MRTGAVVALVALTAAAKLTFINPPVGVPAGDSCPGLLTVQLQDDAGMPVPAPADLTVDLSGGDLRFFATQCGLQPITQVTIDAGTSARSFGLEGFTAGRIPVTASAAGLESATQEVSVVAGPLAKFVYTRGTYPISVGECNEVEYLLADAYDNVSPPPPPGMVVRASSPTPGVRLFLDQACSQGSQDMLVASPDAGSAFFFVTTVPGTLSVGEDVVGPNGFGSSETFFAEPAAGDLELHLADGEGSTGSWLGVTAFWTNTGALPLWNARLVLSPEGVALDDAGPFSVPLANPGHLQEVDVLGTITARLGEEVVVRGHLEANGGVAFGPEVEARRAVAPMGFDLGGCGCSAGGMDLALAGAALALATRLRAPRRRSR